MIYWSRFNKKEIELLKKIMNSVDCIEKNIDGDYPKYYANYENFILQLDSDEEFLTFRGLQEKIISNYNIFYR